LEKRFTHRVCLPVPAVNRDASNNHKAQALLPDDIYYLAQLLRASAQSADFQRGGRITLM
jgi:hypothetical protein